MHQQVLLAFIIYFIILISIGLLASRKQKTAADFILGGRSLNYWVTAISANASDMSAWLFMGLPMVIYVNGAMQFWTAIGLVVFMFLNWHFVAPKLRVATEEYHALTLSSFFERRLADHSGWLRILSACISLVFLTTYIAAGLIGIGYLFESLFFIDYFYGCLLGIAAIIIYTYVGGFTAIAWTDFFQGMFLLGVVLAVPILALQHMGGTVPIYDAAQRANISLLLVPDFSQTTVLAILSMTIGWGFGYFGQPHIINKFMAIKNPGEIYKSKYVSTSWQILALSASALVGMVAIGFFQEPLANNELVFINMVKILFHPFVGGLVLCAILAATLSTMDSQILVLASIIAEDIYKKTFRPHASPRQVLWMSRASVIGISLVALVIAFNKTKTIFELVNYCWVGLGCAFGPLVLMTLYSKTVTRQGAIAGMLFGGLVGALWNATGLPISAMIPGFFGGLAMIYVASKMTRPVV